MKDFPLAVASYSFHGLREAGMLDVFGYLALLRDRYKVPSADIWTGFLPEPDAEDKLDESFIRKVRSALDANGLTLANLCVDGPYVWDADVDRRALHKKRMLSYIRAAGLLGAKTVRIDFGGAAGQPMSGEAFEYIVAAYREYCAICGDLGMRIGPENHWGWDRVPKYLREVKEAVASPHYGHLFHFGNFDGDIAEGEEVAVSYAMHTHISATMLGEAKRIIARLAESGYSGVYSVEHHSGKHEAERTECQLGAVRAIAAELREEGTASPVAPCYFSTVYSRVN